jgi:hypothetical protein
MHYVVSQIDVDGRVFIRHERDDQDHIISHHKKLFSRHSIVKKPLSEISDEDAIRVAELMGFINVQKAEHESDGLWARWYLPKIHSKFFYWVDLRLEASDYLRSKGYALPWRNYSVDDLVQLGWITLKTTTK